MEGYILQWMDKAETKWCSCNVSAWRVGDLELFSVTLGQLTTPPSQSSKRREIIRVFQPEGYILTIYHCRDKRYHSGLKPSFNYTYYTVAHKRNMRQLFAIPASYKNNIALAKPEGRYVHARMILFSAAIFFLGLVPL